MSVELANDTRAFASNLVRVDTPFLDTWSFYWQDAIDYALYVYAQYGIKVRVYRNPDLDWPRWEIVRATPK